jgi:hypothetical protein
MQNNKQTIEAAEIIKVLSTHKGFVCLSALAKAAGFSTAANKEFKKGLNSLIDQGVVKVRQSGWSSERRGTGVHEKTVILLSEVMEFLGSSSGNALDNASISSVLSSGKNREPNQFDQVNLKPGAFEAFIAIITKCRSCKENPVVYMTQDKLPVCFQHSNMLADSDISFPDGK